MKKELAKCLCGSVAEQDDDMCSICRSVYNLEAEAERREANKLDWG